MTRTRAEDYIEAIMQQIDPDSPRYRVLLSARDFKSSWANLGEQLQKVLHQGLYSDWGYASFEDYCRQEIRIRTQTAMKLTRAWSFLAREAPELTAKDRPPQALPDFRAVDLLRRASEEEETDPEAREALRRAVLEEGRSLATVRRQFREAVPPNPEEQRTGAIRAALSCVRRLQGLLADIEELPPDAVPDLTGLADALEQLSSEN